MTTLDLGEISTQVAKQVGIQLTSRMERSLKRTLKAELRQSLSEASDAFYDEMMKQFNVLALLSTRSAGEKIKGTDPTSVENLRDAFIASIRNDLDRIVFEGDTITINVGNKTDWGLDGSRDHELYVLGFWIVGSIGDYAFISKKHYEFRRGKVTSLGAFGEGFMISREAYEKEKWEKATGLSFEQVRHPLSGRSGFTGFNQVAERFDWSPYITDAVQRAFVKVLG